MEFFKTVFRQKNFMFKLGIIVCLLWVIVAFIAPLIAPADPLAQNLDMHFSRRGRRTGSAPTVWDAMYSAGCCTAAGSPSRRGLSPC